MKSSSSRVLFLLAAAMAAVPCKSLAVDATASDFAKCLTITSQFALDDAILTDFPVLVRLSEDISGFSYADFQQSNGGDLRFFDSVGHILSHEIQLWDTAGTSLVWVKLPALSSHTVFHAAYGTALNVPNTPTDTWTAYAGVWHFDEGVSGGTSYDSTANHFDGDNVETIADTDGVLGRAREMAWKGILLTSTTDFVLGSDFSFSGWVYHNPGTVSYDHLFYRKNASGDEYGFASELNNGNLGILDVFGAWGNKGQLDTGLTAGTWHHITLTYGGTRGEQIWFYNDGLLVSSGQIWWQPPKHVSLPIAFGADSDRNDGSYWRGRFDEFRMRTATPTDSWVAAEHATMADSASLAYGTVSTDQPLLFADNPSVSWDGGDVLSIHTELQSGTGDLLLVLTDEGTTNIIASAASAASAYSAAIPGLAADTCYTYAVVATNAAGEVVTREGSDSGTFLFGEIVIEKLLDGDMASGRDAAFVIRRSSAGTATRHPLTIRYTLGGTAVAGTDYTAPSGTVVLPAGAYQTKIETPLLAGATDGATVTATLAPGPYKIGGGTATAMIHANAAERTDLTPSDFTKQLIIQPAVDLGGESVENFPVLVRLGSHITGFDYADFQQADGADLCFFDGTGRILPYEIESWNPTGTSLVWVLAPTFAHDTTLYACYGLDHAVPNSPTDVWDGFAGVWHFDGIDAGGISRDATANLRDARGGTLITGSEGVVAGSLAQDSASTAGDRGIVVPDTAGLVMGNSFTVSGWVYRNAGTPNWDHLFYRKNASGDTAGWASELYDKNLGSVRVYGYANNSKDFPTGLSPETWSYLSLVYNDRSIALFNNGALIASNELANAMREATLPIAFGTDSDRDGNIWYGRFDECRVRLESTGAARAKADYEVMAHIDSLSYSPVMASGVPMLSAPPVLTRAGAKTYTIATSLNGGTGELLAVCNDTVTNQVSGGIVTGAHSYTDIPLTGLVDGTSYTVAIVATNAAGAAVRIDSDTSFLLGDVSIALGRDPYVVHGFNGYFTVSRPDTAAACLHALTVNYTVSGTAVAGTDYADTLAGSVVIPAGEASATIPVALLEDPTPGATLTLSIAPGLYEIGSAASATMLFREESLLTPFLHRVSLTVQGITNETTSLADFPVLVRFGPATIPGFRYRASTGADLVFADAEGRLYPHEIDTWNPTGESLAWVRLPAAATGTVFYAYYGASAENVARIHEELAPTSVWTGYVGVWHLGDSGDANAPVYDATANDLDGTAGPLSLSVADGVLGRARRISTESGNGREKGNIAIPYKPAMDVGAGFTASWWCYGYDYSWTYFICRKSEDGSSAWGIQIEDNRSVLRYYPTSWASKYNLDRTLENGFWYKMAVAYDGSNHRLRYYIDGKLVSDNSYWNSPDNGLDSLYIGGLGGGWGTFNGVMDEVRLHSAALSSERIEAEYLQEKNAGFLLYGPLEATHPATILLFR